MKYSITYEDAMKLVKAYDNFNFSKSEYVISDYKIVTFSYFLCEFKHFRTPLIEDPKINGYDMRGVTFVFNADGSLYRRYLMLSKFFNLDQVETTQYDLVKDKKIKFVTTKEDGSLIAFMGLPDKTIFAKTIKGFSNEQVAGAMKMLELHPNLKEFVKVKLSHGFTPLFEYVSYDNRIVLKYSTPGLKFIGLRNNTDDSFVPAFKVTDIPLISKGIDKKIEGFTLDDLIKKSEVEENKEGWVIGFEDGQMIKIKTHWYWKMHGLRTENIFREDFIIKHYLEETLDELLAQLDEKEDMDAFKFVERVKKAVNNYIIFIDSKVNELFDKYINYYDKDWVRFATDNHKAAFFGLSRNIIEQSDDYNKKKSEFIIKYNSKLVKAKNFVDKWAGFSDDSVSKWKNNG